MNVFDDINRLTAYGLKTGLIEKEDVIFVKNQLLLNLGLDGFESPEQAGEIPAVEVSDLEDILKNLLDYAVAHNLTGGESVVYRDLFDTKLMAVMVSKPSEIIKKFNALYEKSPKEATDFFYKFSQDTDYIRRYRVCKDVKWLADSPYGKLDITINLSKPEKDPKAIAAARNMKQSGYPQCLLCRENEGYAGRVNHAARENHRIIPLKLAGEDWGFQYSPYVYYNEHCIVFNSKHTPMLISRKTFERLLDFVTMFPHYTLGSNADLPIVGGSILTHDHFQGGAYEFPMARAKIVKEITIKGFEDVKSGIINWPMSVLRISSKDKNRLVELADYLLGKWRKYTDESVFIFAETDGEKHNTLNPIARRRGELYELDLVFRNNITTKEHPLGVYHPHSELHHIKKENIGLIEVMGLAILPGRLKTEFAHLEDAILSGEDISSNEELCKHADWVKELKEKYTFTKENVKEILEKETGVVFSKVLEHAGVFKCTEEGQRAFVKFLES
ncbi:UDP-glucose--hexose-1-phosphate uridylyltransferase [Treponema zioleckii]|uniref:UDP-glucose--hexose-1-phosphate uridylyltransferase n=1 Tax=Treponema zioleckii TaxID=331680 RepID=UPI00168B441C|nr:UDP-glucose--hexose-1-phosphate uridylyltransferase [Treponema zioleckii]